MIKGSTLQEDVIIINVYVTNNRTSKYMSQKLIELQGEVDESTVRDLNTPLSEINLSSREKINIDIIEVNSTSLDWI